jgi:hypothetical protein
VFEEDDAEAASAPPAPAAAGPTMVDVRFDGVAGFKRFEG